MVQKENQATEAQHERKGAAGGSEGDFKLEHLRSTLMP